MSKNKPTRVNKNQTNKTHGNQEKMKQQKE